ncbi:MAG: ribose-5-phosphate isomerase RpiA [Methylococcaceae bacterium]|nr:ribose-5-phosphate isomerase RpiA [Methylococcaceae bacterium]MDZ4155096.1 ribose-5-phosphate isomerase RpiA [Methylococcales bacterium]MDP2394459.1 ribose-5-phosphate isomerase RpiA [Methylococcaceae bacterium]MDP3021502.1 ribose-5-phosphate isomerase RpiA [Methylococcaceae bacterium]MDP3390379.1 ribose-5-phosphate isomerase RpiA [Methylococcaceae bacterium]
MNNKQLVAEHAAWLVEDGMVVGLGTGSTANYFIEAIARRRVDEDLTVQVVASSVVSTIKAQQLGLPLLALEHIDQLDLYVDGADEVTADLTLLKGRGADLVREKLLANASDKFLVLIDASKRVNRIGENFPIPIEVMPFAWQLVQRSITKLGGQASLRANATKDGLAVTPHGSLVLDVNFDANLDHQWLNDQLNAIPGIVEHGIFYGLTSAVLCAEQGQVVEQWSNSVAI